MAKIEISGFFGGSPGLSVRCFRIFMFVYRYLRLEFADTFWF